MSAVIADLHTLQQILRQGNAATAKQKTQIAALRAKVPEPILAHFDRSIQRGRPGVALVRHGVCGECHIRVPAGTVYSLAHPTEIFLCDSCGCYLLPAPDEAAEAAPPAVAATPAPKPIARRVRKKPVLAVA